MKTDWFLISLTKYGYFLQMFSLNCSLWYIYPRIQGVSNDEIIKTIWNEFDDMIFQKKFLEKLYDIITKIINIFGFYKIKTLKFIPFKSYT